MDEGPRRAVISSDDHGPLLAITTWFLGCTLILCTVTRLAFRFATRHLPTPDDFFIIAAAALAIGSTVAASFAVESGLGKKSYLLTTTAIEDIQKEMYAATILYVLTIGISKVSITTFLARLACTPFHKTSVVILGALVICWTVTFTMGVMFQCALPRPWAVFSGKCISMLPFWIAACVFDIATDLVIILLPTRIVSSLQLPARKKTVVIFIFALRTLLIVLSITRIIFLDRLMHGDISFDSVPYAIATQAHSTLSVIIACSPALKPFIDNVRTGMLSASLSKRTIGTTFGQDSFGVQPSNTSRSALWASTHTARVSRVPTFPSSSSNDDTKYVSDVQGHIIARPEPATSPIMHISAPIPERQLSFGSRSRIGNRSPPRPPPPPEELRPDLSCFQPRLLGTNSKMVSSEGQMNGRSDERRVEIITKTRQWEVRVEGGCI